jgi:hypothetical protein
MKQDGNVRLTAVGGDSQYHYAHFTLEYGRTTARISVEVEGRAPSGHPPDAYRKLLHHLGVIALEAATGNGLTVSDNPRRLAGSRD